MRILDRLVTPFKDDVPYLRSLAGNGEIVNKVHDACLDNDYSKVCIEIETRNSKYTLKGKDGLKQALKQINLLKKQGLF